MEINIAVIPGDGIGPEITEATEQVLKRVCEIYGPGRFLLLFCAANGSTCS